MNKWGKIYEDPEDLRKALADYFTECDNHTERVLTRGGTLANAPAPQPYTIAGMQLATGLTDTTWRDYKTKYPEMAEVLRWAYKKLEAQWTALTARPNNNGGAIFYLCNISRNWEEPYQSTMSVNVGGQAGNPVAVNLKDDRSRLAQCTEKELDAIEAIMVEAEKRADADKHVK